MPPLPFRGAVGYGIVRTKFHQHSPLWPRERGENRVIWPLRFEFDVRSALAPSVWATDRIQLPEFRGRVRSGFQALESSLARELLQGLPNYLPGDLVISGGLRPQHPGENLPADQVAPSGLSPHAHGQWLLAEIGRMQKYLAETEYPLENRRLDVVWRRVQRSVPSYVFEIQVGGNLSEAMAKLKQAFELWNSNVFLVGADEHRPAVGQLLAGSFHEMSQRLRFVGRDRVEELYRRKKAYRELESQLGIFV